MKKIFSLMAVVLVAATVFTSCKKDEGGNGTYPTKLDGTYGGAYVEGATTISYISFWIDGTNAQLAVFTPQFKTEKLLEGKLDYNTSTGRGTFNYNGSTEISIQAAEGTEAKNVTLIVSGGDNAGEYPLTKLTDAGFEAGAWVGSVKDTTYSLVVKGRNEGYISAFDAKYGLRMMALDTIYGFYQVGVGSVGTLSFTYKEGTTTETIEYTGYRAGDSIVVIGDNYRVSFHKAGTPSYPEDMDGVYGGYEVPTATGTNKVSLWIEGDEAQLVTYIHPNYKVDTMITGQWLYNPYIGFAVISNDKEEVLVHVNPKNKKTEDPMMRIDFVGMTEAYVLDTLVDAGFSKDNFYGLKDTVINENGDTLLIHWSNLTFDDGKGTLVDTTITFNEGQRGSTIGMVFNLTDIYGFYRINKAVENPTIGTLAFEYESEDYEILGYRNNPATACDTLILFDGEGYKTTLLGGTKASNFAYMK